MSALQRVDPELYEAAELDGAGWVHRFRAITMPQIQPETFVVTLTCTIAALKVFGPIYVLTRGGPESSTLVPSYYAYLKFFDKSKVGYGAAIATVLTMLIIAGRRRHHGAAGSQRPPRGGGPLMAAQTETVRVTTPAPARATRHRPAAPPREGPLVRAGRRDRRRGAHDGAVRHHGAQRLQVPAATTRPNGPLSWPSTFYTDGLTAFWDRVNFPAEAAGTRS